MPQEDVEKAIQQGKEALLYVPMNSEQLKNANAEEKAHDARMKQSSMGKATFDSIERNASLTADEKQQVYQGLAKACVEHEIKHAPGGQETTLLRGATPRTNFMTSYLEQYAQDYKNAVVEGAKEELSKVKLPKDDKLGLSSTRFPRAGETPSEAGNDVKPATVEALNKGYQEMGTKLIALHNNSLDKLSPEARDFMKAAAEPAQNRPEIMNNVMSSTLMLKFTSPALSGAAAQMRNDPATSLKGNFLMEASKTMQTFANSVNEPAGSLLDQTKAGMRAGAALLTEDNLKTTQDSYKALAQGGDTLKQFIDTHKQESAGLSAGNEQVAGKRSVREMLGGAVSSLKNTIGDKLSTKGSEQSLKEVRENHPELVEKYKDLQKQMSDLKKQYLDTVDVTKMSDNPSAKIDSIKDDMAKVQKQMDAMKQDNAGLAQLDRSKVGQVVHSGVRDAAKSVGSKLKA